MTNFNKAVEVTSFILGITAIILFISTNNIKIAVLSGIVSVTFIQNQVNKLIKS